MNKIITPAAIAALVFSPFASALELGHGLSLKGFGTVGLVHSDNNQADYVANYYFQPTGAGASRQTQYAVDTRAGIQLDWQAAERISLTAQVISKQFEDKTWTPRLELAFVKFAASPDLDIRIGRIRPAVYMLSSFLDVNYANPWVRPPVEFYSSAPLSRLEGADLIWRPKTGDVTWVVQPYAGYSKLDLPNNADLEAKKIFGINLAASLGDFTLRGGYLQTDLTVNRPAIKTTIAPLLNLYCRLAGAGSVECQQGDALLPNSKKSSFASLGASWDNGDYFVSGEYGRRSSDSFVSDATIWYLGGGMRLGKLTPYLTYSSFKTDSPTSFSSGRIPANFPRPGLPGSNALITGLLTSNPMDQNTTSLGIRYDVAQNMAIKLQWDKVRTSLQDGQRNTGGGMFINQQTGFANTSHSVNLLSASLDFTF